MKTDFYLDQRWLASYFEKDWFDKVIESQSDRLPIFEYPKFSQNLLYSDYHERFVRFISQAISTSGLPAPSTLLEVGSSLGRTFYEICKNVKSIESATLVEPSENLFHGFHRIFEDQQVQRFNVLSGNKELTEIEFNSQEIRSKCTHVTRKLINLPYEKIADEILPHDLIICSNVLDQCKQPRALVDLLKRKTSQDGFLALSCTYQWNDKHIQDPNDMLTNINLLFDDGWKLIGETDIEFKCRRAERFWQTFLSHVAVFSKSV
jgi:hypothetical protein